MSKQVMEKANEVLLFIFPCWGHKHSSLRSIDPIADNCLHFLCWHTEILLVLLAWHRLDLLWTRKKKSIFLYKTFTWDRIQKPSISAVLVKMKDSV